MWDYREVGQYPGYNNLAGQTETVLEKEQGKEEHHAWPSSCPSTVAVACKTQCEKKRKMDDEDVRLVMTLGAYKFL